MSDENLKTLSKEELFDRMIIIMDELLLISDNPDKQNEADKKRDEMHLLRQALEKIDKEHVHN
jgi:hypothetical protein